VSLETAQPAGDCDAGASTPAPAIEPARVPRYRSIAAELARRIETRELQPGARLPSEMELSAQFAVTRMTVRQALGGLAARGLIERRPGHGTVVAPVIVRRQLRQPIGFADELRSRGFEPGSRVLDFEKVKSTEEARTSLWVGPRGSVFRLRRLRYADGVLIGLQESLIPTKHAPGLAEVDFSRESLIRVLRERHGLVATYADLTIEAVGADEEVSGALDIELGAPVLQTTRVGYLEDGRPLERTVGWFLGARYSFFTRQGLASV
jgi:GntR family transcriptional regulator